MHNIHAVKDAALSILQSLSLDGLYTIDAKVINHQNDKIDGGTPWSSVLVTITCTKTETQSTIGFPAPITDYQLNWFRTMFYSEIKASERWLLKRV